MENSNEERNNLFLFKPEQMDPALTVLTPLNFLPTQITNIKSKSFAPMALVYDAKSDKTNKLPINIDTGEMLKWRQEPDKISTFSKTMQFLKAQSSENIKRVRLGIFLTNDFFGDGSNLIVIDIDHRKDLVEQVQNHKVTSDDIQAKVVEFALESGFYIEISQSMQGLHIFLKGHKENSKLIRNSSFEYYDHDRWICTTGNSVNPKFAGKLDVDDKTIRILESVMFTQEERDRSLKPAENVKISNEKFDDKTIDTIIYKAEHAKNSAYFIELLNGSSPSGDTSSDDLAFCNLLAFWTKKNPEMMDAIFRKSKRMRPKWDEVHSADGKTYGEMTIDASLNFVTEVYNEARNTFPTNANVANKFKSMSDLFTALSDLSLNWRKAHADKKGNPADYGDMSDRVILSLLASIEPFRILVSDPTNPNETVKAPIYFYDWDTGLWSNDGDRIESMILAVNPTITSRRKRQDLVDTLKKSPEFDVKITKLSVVTDSEHRYIPVGNGVFDEEKQELLSFDPNRFFFVSKISTPFDPNATVEPAYNGWSVSRMILNIATDPVTKKVDDEKVKLLWEILKAGATGASWLRVSVLLKDSGQGSTGKSTFTDLLTNLIGQQNVANLRLVDLQDPTKLIEATHVNLIIGDDNDPEIPLSKFDNFNTVVSSDPLRVRSYYKESYSTRLHVFMIQSANGLPPLTKAKAAVYNRLVVVDFNTQFDSSKDANWHVKHDYIKREDLLKWLLNYLLTKVKLGHSLTQTKESQKELKEIRTESDSVYTFSNEVLDLIPVSAVPSTYMYALYFDWSRANGVPRRLILSQPKFTRELRKQEAFIKSWDYVPKNCQIKDPWSFTSPNVMKNTTDPFANKNQENAYTLLKDYAYQVNEYQTMDFSLPQGKKYRGSGFERKPQKSDTKVESNK